MCVCENISRVFFLIMNKCLYDKFCYSYKNVCKRVILCCNFFVG